MKILVHDYAGYPFPVQLSRELAKRGHQVLHLYAGYNNTPRGVLRKEPNDPKNFFVKPIYTQRPLNKYALIKRWFQEREYGQLLVNEIKGFYPDVVLSADTPLDAQFKALRCCERGGIRFIFWLQDVVSIATDVLMQNKIHLFGKAIGQYYIRMERNILQRSDHIVPITEDFSPLVEQWGIPVHKITIIPNWAPIDYLPVQPKINPWSKANELADTFCIMYTGALGMKHDPALLLQLAISFRNDPYVRVAVISEGPGAVWLLEKKQKYKLDNLKILGYQPFEQLQFVLASADVLVAILEPDAGIFSVPSKVLTYLCARRPLLLSIPLENLAARIVYQNNAGLIVNPENREAFLTNAQTLRNDFALREFYAANGRTYAERTFDIQKIASEFESVIEKCFDVDPS